MAKFEKKSFSRQEIISLSNFYLKLLFSLIFIEVYEVYLYPLQGFQHKSHLSDSTLALSLSSNHKAGNVTTTNCSSEKFHAQREMLLCFFIGSHYKGFSIHCIH